MTLIENFDKIQHSFMIEIIKRLVTEEVYMDILKAIYNNQLATIILNAENLKHTHTKMSTLFTVIQHSLKSSQTNRTREGNTWDMNRKG